MIGNKEPLIIYWTPATYESDKESWSLLYPEPVSLYSQVNKLRPSKVAVDNVYACPAFKDTTRNVFVFKNPVENIVTFPKGFLEAAAQEIAKHENYPTNSRSFGADLNSKIFLNVIRKSSFEGYANVFYNFMWLFVAEEPVIAKSTPPYYPHSSPADGAMLSMGEFDIGQWFIPFQLDYHIPMSTEKMTFLEGDDLLYLHILTDRPVVFKRFMRTPTIAQLQIECGAASARYGLFKPLTEKYVMAKKAKLREQMISEIKKNLVE